MLARTAKGTFVSLMLASSLFVLTLLGGLGFQRALERSGADLLGGDVEIRTVHRPVAAQRYARIEGVQEIARMTSLRSMLQVGDQYRLVQITAVEESWPLRGQLVTEPLLNAKKLGPKDVLVEPSLARRFDLKIGQKVQVAGQDLTVRGIVVAMPGGFSQGPVLGPRILMSRAALESAGLLQVGSLFHDHLLLNVAPGQLDAVLSDVNSQAQEDGARVRERRAAAPATIQIVSRVAVGFALMVAAGLIIAAYGLRHAVMTQRHLREPLAHDLRALGMAEALIKRLMIIALLLPGFIATCIGVVLGVILLLAVGLVLPQNIPFLPVLFDVLLVSISVVLYAVCVSLLAVMARRAWWHWVGLPLLSASIFAIILGLQPALFAMIFTLIPLLLEFIATRIAPIWGTLAYHSRPSLRAIGRVLRQPELLRLGFSVGAVGALAFATILVALSSLRADLDQRLSVNAPTHFVVDLRQVDVESFTDMLRAHNASDVKVASMLRGVIRKINGIASQDAQVGSGSAWMLRGDRGITFADQPPEGIDILEGAWWPEGEQKPSVSLDQRAAQDLGLKIGDTIEVDILGQPIMLTVAALREINWAGGGMNFSLMVNKAVGEQLPLGYISSFSLSENDMASAEADMARLFPMVSVVRVQDVIAPVQSLLNILRYVLTGLGGLLLFGALLVLTSALLAQIRLRKEEFETRRLLGATKKQIQSLVRLEMGALAGLVLGVGMLMGLIMVWVVFYLALSQDIVVPWVSLIVGLVIPWLVILFLAGSHATTKLR